MSKLPSTRQLALLLITTLVVGIAHADSEASADVWLQRMGTALREQNYVGTFTFMRGREFNTMRIAHRYADGQEHERLYQLSGDVLDIVRIDDDVTCHHDHDQQIDLGHSVSMGPFTSLFSQNIALFQNQYQISLHGEGRVADRPAVKLAITPRGNDRYGYRLWLDRETGLLLKSHLVDRNQVKELFQFVEIEIGGDIAPQSLLAAVDDTTVTHKLTVDVLDESRQPTLKVAWLPEGFRMVRTTPNRLHFSDGLASFSVFIERVKALPDMSTEVGGKAVITRTLNDRGQVTVIGELPVATARRVAESVEPVVY